MNEYNRMPRTRFQERFGVPPSATPVDADGNRKCDDAWLGPCVRIVSREDAPAMQFRLHISRRESIQIKYAHITHQSFIWQNAEQKNSITLIVRDSLRLMIAGMNLNILDDALLWQRVVDIQSVPEFHGDALLRENPSHSMIIDISLEYGRYDVENNRWLPGNGHWCPTQKQWIMQVKPIE